VKTQKALRSSWSRLLNYITTISCHNDESATVVVADDASSSSLLLLLSAAGHNASCEHPLSVSRPSGTEYDCMPRCRILSCTPWSVCRSACNISSSDAGSPRVFHSRVFSVTSKLHMIVLWNSIWLVLKICLLKNRLSLFFSVDPFLSCASCKN